MPTYCRPDYAAESIAMFLEQDYPAKELIVLNDCPGQRFCGDIADVRRLNTDSRYPTLGEKRNVIDHVRQYRRVRRAPDRHANLLFIVQFRV